MKRVHIISERKNCAHVVEAKAIYSNEYINKLSTFNNSKIYFVNENRFNVSMRIRKNRSLVGTRAVYNVSAPRSRIISVYCSMNKNKIFKYLSQTKTYNTESFTNYILFLIDKMTTLSILKAVFVMNNVPFYKCTPIKQTIGSADHYVIYLLFYSPFLNLIRIYFLNRSKLFEV
ncbi:hypothetical protein CDIK_2164 [Cucumispora dikerogammari]|nr:hypothetical protein CDIK_2164 [Cucumispora dikerogammari]